MAGITVPLVEKLTASGGSESAGFLNDIVAQLWPHINVAGGKMIKDIVEPMLASMLPGPLASLRFTKIDLGNVPMRFSAVDVHKTENEAIKLDMDLDWDGECDFDLEGKMVPKVGVKKAHVRGRLSVLLSPLTDIIPLIGAAQVAFINPPALKLDFTDAANIADCFLIEKTVRKVILSIISSMAVLPNRYLVKLDTTTFDWFAAHQPHLGVLRLTVDRAANIAGPKPAKSGAKRLLDKLIKDVPDCFVDVTLGAEQAWRTQTQKNNRDPVWGETHDFLVADFEQAIMLDVNDDDTLSDDDIGTATTTVKQILLNGGTQELDLVHDGQRTESKITIHAKFFNVVSEPSVLTSSESSTEEGQICGLATVLVASVQGLEGSRDALHPSVKVAWGDKTFRTAVQAYAPGMDIFNPSFDTAFRIPVTKEMVDGAAAFRIVLMNKEEEVGEVEIPFREVVEAEGMVKKGGFEVGGGATVRASVMLTGMRLAEL